MATSFLPLLILLLASITSSSSIATTSTTLHLLHPSPSSTSDLLSLLSSDTLRVSSLAASTSPHPSPVPIASGTPLLRTPTYLLRSSLGSPPQPLLLSLDTSNDASFIPSSAFNPSLSSSYNSLPCSSSQCSLLSSPSCPAASSSCSFNFTYGSSAVSAVLSQDSLSLGSNLVPNFIFSSITNYTGSSVPSQGLLGLGRGPLSFVSQTKPLYSSTFSYCLPSFRSSNFSGSLRLGPTGQPVRIKSTPLLSNPRRPSLYYVNLQRIRVGSTVVPVPDTALAFNPSTGAGTIIDSGTMFTRLVTPAYEAVRDEFRRRVKAPVTTLGGFDTCYHDPVKVPTITFEFAGMNVTLPAENVMIHSSSGDLQCLAMAAAPENVNSVVNVIASMQQQNHRVLVDGGKGSVGIAREMCTRA